LNTNATKPVYKRVWFWLVVFFVLPPIVTAFSDKQPPEAKAANNETKVAAAPDTPSTSSFSAGTTQKYKLSNFEHNILQTVLDDEVKAFTNGDEALLGQRLGLKYVTGSKLASAYDANEAAADKEYKGKQLFVTARVDSINKGIGGSPYFVIRGGVLGAQAHFERKYNDYAASVSKGEIVKLVCEGNGYIITSAMLDDCVPAQDVAKREANDVLKQIARVLNGASGDQTAKQMVLGVVSLAKVIPEAACTAANSQCLDAVIKAGKDEKNMKAALDQAKSELSTLGIDLTSNKASR
jgi:hypothetical protein